MREVAAAGRLGGKAVQIALLEGILA